MKRILLTATALGAIATMIQPAAAQTAGPKAPFTAVLDGSVVAVFGAPSGTQSTAHNRDLGMRTDSDMRFKFEGHADNGLVYGWYGRIEGDSSTVATDNRTINREYMYLNSSYGNVQLGAAANVTTSIFSGACGLIVPANYGPCDVPNQLGPDGGLEPTLLTDPNAIAINNALYHTAGGGSARPGFTTKLRYDSPSINGFTFRFSYSPDGKQRNEENFATDTTNAAALTSSTDEGNGFTSRFQNYIEAALQYKGTFGAIGNFTGVVFTHADPKDLTFGTAAVKPINNTIVGTQFTYGGWTWGVAYNWVGQNGYSNTVAKPTQGWVDSWGWSTGLEYDTGPWRFGGWYQYARAQGAFATNGLIELNYLGVGAGYVIAPGLKAFGEGFYYQDFNTHAVVGNPATQGRPSSPRGQIYMAGLDFEW